MAHAGDDGQICLGSGGGELLAHADGEEAVAGTVDDEQRDGAGAQGFD